MVYGLMVWRFKGIWLPSLGLQAGILRGVRVFEACFLDGFVVLFLYYVRLSFDVLF